MSDLNFEQDKKELLSEASGVKTLSNQVVKLRDLEDKIKEKGGDIIISVSEPNISASLKTARYFINLFRV